ncbi:MAG: DUF4011 domain-containing protein [Brevibacterium yomogidense]
MSESASALPPSVDDVFVDWRAQAARIGGRDTMLHFRESRDGSIDLTGAHPSGLAQLLAGRATRLSSLLRDPEHLSDARRRARSIRSKADQLQRQRGIAAAQLAIGFASWNRPKDSGREDFAAPVILRHVNLLPRGSSVDDYEISLSDEVRINPALVDYLRQEHDVIVDVDEWVAATGLAHGFDPAPVFNRLRTLTRPVLGMLVNERLVVSTFANITAPYASESLPAAHPLLRALAGDAEARVGFRLPGTWADEDTDPDADSDSTATTDSAATAVSSTASGATDDGVPTERIDMSDPADQGPRPLPDRAPHEEFLAIDVDGDQQAVVDSALDGASLVVDTPPGTGATQLAVALSTSLTHSGRSVLFVAQDEDELGDFSQRMSQAGLEGFAIDGRGDGEALRRSLIRLISSAERTPQPELTGLVDRLSEQRAALREHGESLHRIREPWGVSAYEVMERLAALTAVRPGPSTSVRFDRTVLELSTQDRADLRTQLLELSRMGAFTMEVSDTVWFGARVDSSDEVTRAQERAKKSVELVPEFSRVALPVLRESGLNPERTIGAWGRALLLLQELRKTLDVFSPDVFEHSLSDLIAATGTAEYRAQAGRDMGLFERNRLKKAAREFLRPGAQVTDMHEGLLAASQQRKELKELAGGDIRPKVPRGIPEAVAEYRALSAELSALSPTLATTPDGGELEDMLVEELEARLQALAEENESLSDLPARTRTDDALRDAGLSELLDDLRDRRVSHDVVGLEFDLALWATILQDLAGADALIGAHDGAVLHRIAADYRISDRQYVAAGASRLRYGHARRWKRAIADERDQAQIVRDTLRSDRPTVAEITARAPDIVTTLAPVWTVTPFQVPELFADMPLFDTVIVADAGRLTTSEVLPALARAKQVIALGDMRLPGPRDFSVTVDRRTLTPEEAPKSVWEDLAEFLPLHRLHTSYRVSPLELVELANRHFYDGHIRTVPTALTGEGSGLEFAYVPDAMGSPDTATGQVESLDVEVEKVVDLVIRHARTRARQSLAVITLTPWHAQRVAAGIQKAIRQFPYVAAFFEDPDKEPFVVTDCEQIQGMDRDAVILSLGYGRTRHGRVIHSFGPLSQPGGDRLLAAAVTRARRRLTVVSAFEADDFDPARLDHGAALLPALLGEIASGGEPTERTYGAVTGTGTMVRSDREEANRIATEPAAELGDPIVTDLAERLSRKGVLAHLDYQGIDLAIANSADAVHGMVVAVESDGAMYANTESIRQRERLRPEQLARRGWRSVRIWTTDAFVDPQRQANRLFEAWKETVEELSPQALLNAARAAAVVVDRQGSRPRVASGLPMHMYTDEQLIAMIEWIQSDGVSRSDTDLKEQLRAALAQKLRSARTESALDSAVKAYRAWVAASKRAASNSSAQTEQDSEDSAASDPTSDAPLTRAQRRVAEQAAAAEAAARTPSTGTVVDEDAQDADAAPEAIPADQIIPSYDTDSLRHAELRDAGLREWTQSADADSSEDHSPEDDAADSGADTAAEPVDTAATADAEEPADDTDVLAEDDAATTDDSADTADSTDAAGSPGASGPTDASGSTDEADSTAAEDAADAGDPAADPGTDSPTPRD